ncbi:MAG: HD domain-containing protein, partial [Muribaculaceae bacterium]|nr:HD domain-containing protein [Muribaculaceae bacterium]
MENALLKPEELIEIRSMARSLLRRLRPVLMPDDLIQLKRWMRKDGVAAMNPRDAFGLPTARMVLDTALTLCDNLSVDRNMVLALFIYLPVRADAADLDAVKQQWGDDIAKLVRGLVNVAALYDKSPAVANDNFRKLLLTLAEDIRVIIITIVGRLALMRAINHNPNEDMVKQVALESRYLYSQLAHRLGLYTIKSELEDMSLKYSERDTYTSIAHQLNAKKEARDAYMDAFMKPVRERLEQSGLKFEMKGRTKSIYSIWNKMKKQQNDLDHIYDLFAIRVILDSPPEKEKSDCWTVYSLITDMYQPNPSRMKDWLSIPKSNGYESLHITVRGPEGKWVEVQIRSRRMDEIAERGLAAHWKYKGVKAENNLDAWMNNVRDILEAADSDPMGLMRNLKMDVYDQEVFVFTPKGDLYKLPLGATVLDFAFNIHSKLGCSCTGGKVNGKNQKINYKLHSGDTVEILTSNQQTPKADWLNFTVTSKARTKIRQSIKEQSG